MAKKAVRDIRRKTRRRFVSQQLGHSDVAVTARHYARWRGGEGYRDPMAPRTGRGSGGSPRLRRRGATPE
jgi:integrase